MTARVLQRKETSTTETSMLATGRDASAASNRDLYRGNSGSPVEAGGGFALVIAKITEKGYGGGGGRKAFAAETMNSRETNLPPF